jgi:hypothetical protein
MALRFTLLHPLLAAEAGGVDLARPLAVDQAADIVAAMDRYAVLFRGATTEDILSVA